MITRSYIGRRPAVWMVIGACAAVGLLLRLYQLSRPGFLLGVTQYDDGVLFGNALRLAAGVIPYRDFIMVQPPGSMLLMTPVALLAKVTGSAWGLALARILTVFADTACIVLLGLLVRHRGVLVVAIACGFYAVDPSALAASSTFFLEPWLNLCCLGAALLIFDGNTFASNRRLVLGGAVFGFAISIKLWAAVPLLVVGLLLIGRPARLGRLGAGALAGLAVPVLPFLALAPGRLVSQVITSQYLRSTLPHPLLPRLADMAGLTLWHWLPETAGIVLLLPAVAGYLIAGNLASRRPLPVLDRYALAGLAATVVMFLLPQEYYSHYAAFVMPFAALALALPASRLLQLQRRPAIGPLTLPVCAVLVTALVAATGLRQVTAVAQAQAPPAQVAAVDRLIPAGTCVITNNPALTIVANRFVAAQPGCPSVVDTYGTLLTMTGGRPQNAAMHTMRAAERTWQRWFHQATFVWLGAPDHGLPWANSLYNYLGEYFERVQLADHPATERGGLFLHASPSIYRAVVRHLHHSNWHYRYW